MIQSHKPFNCANLQFDRIYKASYKTRNRNGETKRNEMKRNETKLETVPNQPCKITKCVQLYLEL